MTIFRNLIVALALLAGVSSTNAATCFWVGGTGTWDNSTDAAHWSSSTGGSGSTCAATGGFPKNAADTAIFDGASGGGTVTNNVDLTITSISMGAFTGTLTWATNNHNLNLSSFSNSGTGTRTLSMGGGTWTFVGQSGTIWDHGVITNLTFNSNSSTIVYAPAAIGNSSRVLVLNTLTYNAITLNDPVVSVGNFKAPIITTGAATITTLAVTNAYNVELAGGATTTVTNAFSWTMSSAQPGFLGSQSTNNAATLSVGGAVTMNWVSPQNIAKAGAGSIAMTNALDFGGNSGITITSPAGGGRIIGGFVLKRDIDPADNDNSLMWAIGVA